jgi:hypothetical protein
MITPKTRERTTKPNNKKRDSFNCSRREKRDTYVGVVSAKAIGLSQQQKG